MDNRDRQKAFRKLLREIRLEAGLNQAALAHRLGRTQTFVSKVELGESRIDLLQTFDFCAACGVPFPKFLARLEMAGITSPIKKYPPVKKAVKGAL